MTLDSQLTNEILSKQVRSYPSKNTYYKLQMFAHMARFEEITVLQLFLLFIIAKYL